MKKYIIPEMKLSRFNRENVLTASGETPAAQTTAMEQARAAANSISDSKMIFTVVMD